MQEFLQYQVFWKREEEEQEITMKSFRGNNSDTVITQTDK